MATRGANVPERTSQQGVSSKTHAMSGFNPATLTKFWYLNRHLAIRMMLYFVITLTISINLRQLWNKLLSYISQQHDLCLYSFHVLVNYKSPLLCGMLLDKNILFHETWREGGQLLDHLVSWIRLYSCSNLYTSLLLTTHINWGDYDIIINLYEHGLWRVCQTSRWHYTIIWDSKWKGQNYFPT